jgi:hypothetical protein
MSGGERHGMSHHPAPHRDRVAVWETVLGFAGGPLAWLVQLCVSYGLAADPCYAGPERVGGGTGMGTGIGIILVLLGCLAVAATGAVVSLRVYRRTRHEMEGSAGDLFEGGRGRTRFLALWGILLGAGFAGLILLNGVALVGVPACDL